MPGPFFMDGKLPEFEATRMHDKTIRKGREEGVQEGAILDRIEILRDYGESDENIINTVCARFKISKEEALKYMELQKSTNSQLSRVWLEQQSCSCLIRDEMYQS